MLSVSLHSGLNLALWLFLLDMCTGAFLALQQTAKRPRQAASFPSTLNCITLGNGKKGESRDIVGSVSWLLCKKKSHQKHSLSIGVFPRALLATSPSAEHKRMEEHGGLESLRLWLGPKHLNWARCKNANSGHVLGSSVQAQLCL